MDELIAGWIEKLQAEGFRAGRGFPPGVMPGDGEAYVAVAPKSYVVSGETVLRAFIYTPRQSGAILCDQTAEAAAAVIGPGTKVSGAQYSKEADSFLAELQWQCTPATSTLSGLCGEDALQGLLEVTVTQTNPNKVIYAIGANKPGSLATGPLCYRILLRQAAPEDRLDLKEDFQLTVPIGDTAVTFKKCRWEKIQWEQTRSGMERTAQAISFEREEVLT